MNPLLEYGNEPDRLLEIEFLGGPYDGHIEIRHTQARFLPESVIWLVAEEVFRLLDGQDLRQCGHVGKPFASVALYTLQRDSGKNLYRFAGSVSVDQLMQGLNDS